MTKEYQYGVMHRGNGYGYFNTIAEARKVGEEKRAKDNSKYAYDFGRPEITLYLCQDNKPIKPLNS